MTLPLYVPFTDVERARTRLLAALAEPHDTYLLLTGETGMGKSHLLRTLRDTLECGRWRVVYFAHARGLSASGLIRTLAQALRVGPKRSHPETILAIARQMADEPTQLLLVLDQAHELPDETLTEARTLAEHDLGGTRTMRVVLAGLPALRGRLQANPEMWRRLGVREELNGLVNHELAGFLAHHLGSDVVDRLGEATLALIFERGRGAPGQVLPMVRHLLRQQPGDEPVDERVAEDELRRWDLA